MILGDIGSQGILLTDFVQVDEQQPEFLTLLPSMYHAMHPGVQSTA